MYSTVYHGCAIRGAWDMMHLRMCKVLKLSEDSPALCVSLVKSYMYNTQCMYLQDDRLASSFLVGVERSWLPVSLLPVPWHQSGTTALCAWLSSACR